MADGLEQVGLAEAGVAVDEQRVVLAGRRLGDGQGGGVGEPVGRADHEGVEGVPRVDVVHRDVTGPPAAREGGRRGGRRDGPRGLGLGGRDLEGELDVAGPDLGEGVPDEREVAALDALLGQERRHRQREHAARRGDRAGRLEAT